MIDIRPFATLGHVDHGWLNARHHFSFASYRDPQRMGWGAIRVWNDDTIAAGGGFEPHPHNDMEIVTFVRQGAVSHKDSLGNEGRTAAGDVQVMSAGTGIDHSEFNHEDTATTLFQIWIIPDSTGDAPSWGQREFPRADHAGRWITLASGNPDRDEALPIRADARVLAARLGPGDRISHTTGADRHVYMVPASGSLRIDGRIASAGDGIAITGETIIEVEAIDEAEVIMVDAR